MTGAAMCIYGSVHTEECNKPKGPILHRGHIGVLYESARFINHPRGAEKGTSQRPSRQYRDRIVLLCYGNYMCTLQSRGAQINIRGNLRARVGYIVENKVMIRVK